MARIKKWNEGEFDQVKVKVPKEINKRYKGWLLKEQKTAQEHLESEIIKVVVK